MKDDETLSNYLTRLNDLINQMKAFGETLSNERMVQKVLINLTKAYEPICLVIENTKDLTSVEFQEVIAILKSQEQRLDLQVIDSTKKAFSTLFKGKPKCYNCDKFGHWARECTNGRNMQKANCTNQMELSGNMFYAASETDGSSKSSEWVRMSNRTLENIAGKGTLMIDTDKGKRHIKEVLYLPGLKENLLSVGQMDEPGCYLMFGGGTCNVYDGPTLENLVVKVKAKTIQ
nr:uncharacterized protein LOC125422944 [Ziziphus jujuba var. spinosa]